jgi:NAD(P)H-hydrate epimerase
MVRVGSPGVADDPRRPVEAVGLDLPAEGWDRDVLELVDRFGSLVVGPGLGRDDARQAAARAVLANAGVPTVVDADALVALAGDLGPSARRRPTDTVLTPHDGEYEQLLGSPPGADRIAAARRLATATGSVALLKGSATVVAHPDGRVRITTTGSPRLATAGTGDVLSGVIGALLARGMDALEAAAAGAWLHGRAADLGPENGLLAGDLPDLLPRVLAEVAS